MTVLKTEYFALVLFGCYSLALIMWVAPLSWVILKCAKRWNGVKKCFIQQNICNLVEAAVHDKSPFSGRHLFAFKTSCDLVSV